MTQIWLDALPVFLLIFCRVTAFFVISPIFTYRSIPTIFKIGLGFFISLIIFMMHGDNQPILTVDLTYTVMVIREVLIGIMLGYIVYLFFALIHVAGGIIDIMIGFSMANVLDPATGISVSITANFKYLLMLVCFLMMNGHHYLITGLMDSFQYIPLDNNWFARMADGSLAQVIQRLLLKVC